MAVKKQVRQIFMMSQMNESRQKMIKYQKILFVEEQME